MKILICLNSAWNLVNFRWNLIRALIDAGHEVVAAAPMDRYAPRLSEIGCRFVDLPMDSSGTNPFRDLALLGRLAKLIWSVKPDVFLGYTIKPNVYGSLVARLFNTPVINNIAGLGSVFAAKGILSQFVCSLYRLALLRSRKVFFQNAEDLQQFVAAGIVREEVTDILPGSGVDLKRFRETPLPSSTLGGKGCVFLVVARMLREKGLIEFAEAAKIVRKNWPEARFLMLGFLDFQNPRAITEAELRTIKSCGVEYLGQSDDVFEFIAQADCVVLPSYYKEGTPRSLLEAAAVGRPIITTDTPGCRDVVNDGVTGFLCRPGSAIDLSEKMLRLIVMSNREREAMGAASRRRMEISYDEKIVLDKYIATISEVR